MRHPKGTTDTVNVAGPRALDHSLGVQPSITIRPRWPVQASSAMPLRLGQLRDCTPAKLTLALDPDTHAVRTDYAALYRQTYGHEERPETLAAP